MAAPPAVGALNVEIPAVPRPASADAGGAWTALIAANDPRVPPIPAPAFGSPNLVLNSMAAGANLPTFADVTAANELVDHLRAARRYSPNLVSNEELAQAQVVASITQAEYSQFGPSFAAPGVAALTTAVNNLNTLLTNLSNTVNAITNSINNLTNSVTNLDQRVQTGMSNLSVGLNASEHNFRTVISNQFAFRVESANPIHPLVRVENAQWGLGAPPAGDGPIGALVHAEMEFPNAIIFPAAGLMVEQFDALTGPQLTQLLMFYNLPVDGTRIQKSNRLKHHLGG